MQGRFPSLRGDIWTGSANTGQPNKEKKHPPLIQEWPPPLLHTLSSTMFHTTTKKPPSAHGGRTALLKSAVLSQIRPAGGVTSQLSPIPKEGAQGDKRPLAPSRLCPAQLQQALLTSWGCFTIDQGPSWPSYIVSRLLCPCWAMLLSPALLWKGVIPPFSPPRHAPCSLFCAAISGLLVAGWSREQADPAEPK